MAQTFPPLPPPPPSAVILHVVLLLLAIGSVVGLFVKSRRRAQAGDLVLWPAVMLVAALVFGAGRDLDPAYLPFLLGYMLFVWAVAGAACVISIVRLKKQGQAAAAVIIVPSLLALGLLIWLSLPAVPQAREAARRTQCRNNTRQIMLAIHNWHEAHGRLPDSQFAADDEPPRSWRVELAPYLDYADLRRRYDDSKLWDDEANLPVAQSLVPSLSCPAKLQFRDAQERYFTPYLLVTGPRTMLPDGRGTALSPGLMRGPGGGGRGSSIIVAEAAGLNVVWTRPWDLDVQREPIGVNLPGREPTHSPGLLSSYHRGGAHVGLVDGSVRFLSEKADPHVIRALLTANGGEDVGEVWSR